MFTELIKNFYYFFDSSKGSGKIANKNKPKSKREITDTTCKVCLTSVKLKLKLVDNRPIMSTGSSNSTIIKQIKAIVKCIIAQNLRSVRPNDITPSLCNGTSR